MLRVQMACSVLLAGITAVQATAWQPTGALEELYDDALLARLRPGVQAASFSSYDRSGGNNDGFSGEYSKLREEDGNSVIAEMEGPGCINRIWFTHSLFEKEGLLDLKGEHLRIYLDGETDAALDVPIEALFDNSLEHFPHPIAGKGIGGFYSYIPIPYRKSCKVVVDGLGVRFYQLNHVTFPSVEGVRNFTLALSDTEKSALARAVARWSDPLGTLEALPCEQRVFPVNHDFSENGAENPPEFLLPNDDLTLVHGIVLKDVSPEALARAYIEIMPHEAGAEKIFLPLTLFFGQAFSAGPFQSLLFGRMGDAYYNRVPLVYRGGCTLRLHSLVPITGTLSVFQTPLDVPDEEMGRLSVQVNESLPTQSGVMHPFLRTEGAGHVIGVYLITEGPKGLPYWLEGDDQWVIDGALRIHGTGSEDYFNCGWYALEGRLNGPEVRPSHGFTIYGETADTMRAAAVRWHMADPVPFSKSMDSGIEHGAANKHTADYRSLTFYYRSSE